jgi:hypothetical protein
MLGDDLLMSFIHPLHPQNRPQQVLATIMIITSGT